MRLNLFNGTTCRVINVTTQLEDNTGIQKTRLSPRPLDNSFCYLQEKRRRDYYGARGFYKQLKFLSDVRLFRF